MHLKCSYLKKNLVGISSNFLYSIYDSENVIKIGGEFAAIFWNKAWAILQDIFQKLAYFKCKNINAYYVFIFLYFSSYYWSCW